MQARHDGVVEAKRSAGLETIVTRMRGRLVASAVWQWREWARARQQLQARARRVVGRVRQAGVASAYVGWAEYREQKRRARRIGARLQRLALRRAVWGWAEGASLVRGEREASAHEAVEQALREEMRCSREELELASSAHAEEVVELQEAASAKLRDSIRRSVEAQAQ